MGNVPKEWIKFVRDQYPVGSQIKLRETKEPGEELKPGMTGALKGIDDDGRFHVLWSNGISKPVIIGEDSFSVQLPEPVTMKLYMPLSADAFERNEWGDMEDTPVSLTDYEILSHEDAIISALVKYRMPEDAERGIMHWYHEDDAVNNKVKSCVFTAEARNGKLWGVAECRVVGELSPTELDTLKEYISGQASDGWGEGFEQREIETHDGGDMYVHLWSFDRSWSIETEQERFGPKLAEGLPEMCFSALPDTGALICIKRGESGYYPSDWNTSDRERNIQIRDDANESLGVTAAQRHAMETGSMFGWNVPGADPAMYQEAPSQQKGGMTFG